MDSDDIIAEIVNYLAFEAVNAFARTSVRMARAVKKASVDIADKYARQDHFTAKSPNKPCNLSAITTNKLPNGVSHGRTSFFDMDYNVLFRVTYELGSPTYWRASNKGFDIKFGHMSLSAYVWIDRDDAFENANMQLHLGGHTIMCCRKGPSMYWANDVDEPKVFAPEVLPPKILTVNGDIYLPDVEKWHREISYRVQILSLHEQPVRLFEWNPELAEMILKYCPDLDGLMSPTYPLA